MVPQGGLHFDPHPDLMPPASDLYLSMGETAERWRSAIPSSRRKRASPARQPRCCNVCTGATHTGHAVLRRQTGYRNRVLTADAVVLATGMVAAPFAAHVPGRRDDLGRIVVDETLRAPAVQATKRMINTQAIHPPADGTAESLFAGSSTNIAGR